MPKDKREVSLEKIRNSKTTRCILISFKAGSTGEFCDILCLPLVFRRLRLPRLYLSICPPRTDSQWGHRPVYSLGIYRLRVRVFPRSRAR